MAESLLVDKVMSTIAGLCFGAAAYLFVVLAFHPASPLDRAYALGMSVFISVGVWGLAFFILASLAEIKEAIDAITKCKRSDEDTAHSPASD